MATSSSRASRLTPNGPGRLSARQPGTVRTNRSGTSVDVLKPHGSLQRIVEHRRDRDKGRRPARDIIRIIGTSEVPLGCAIDALRKVRSSLVDQTFGGEKLTDLVFHLACTPSEHRLGVSLTLADRKVNDAKNPIVRQVSVKVDDRDDITRNARCLVFTAIARLTSNDAVRDSYTKKALAELGSRDVS